MSREKQTSLKSAGRGPGAPGGGRHRDRHPRRVPGPRVRSLLSGRPRAVLRRRRAGPEHLPVDRRGSRRLDQGRERPRPRQHVHRTHIMRTLADANRFSSLIATVSENPFKRDINSEQRSMWDRGRGFGGHKRGAKRQFGLTGPDWRGSPKGPLCIARCRLSRRFPSWPVAIGRSGR